MTTDISPCRKSNLLLLIALFVGLGMAATRVVQAAPPASTGAAGNQDRTVDGSEKWWRSIWGLDLARKLKEWRPRITVQKDAEGLNLARPFGKSGPTIQCTSALPDSVQRSLLAGSRNRLAGENTDLFLFLQKRW